MSTRLRPVVCPSFRESSVGRYSLFLGEVCDLARYEGMISLLRGGEVKRTK